MKNNIINKLSLLIACVAGISLAPEMCLTGCFAGFMLHNKCNGLITEIKAALQLENTIAQQRNSAELELRQQVQLILRNSLSLPPEAVEEYVSSGMHQIDRALINSFGGDSGFVLLFLEEWRAHDARVQSDIAQFRNELNSVLGTGDFSALEEIRTRYEQALGVQRARAILAEETVRRT